MPDEVGDPTPEEIRQAQRAAEQAVEFEAADREAIRFLATDARGLHLLGRLMDWTGYASPSWSSDPAAMNRHEGLRRLMWTLIPLMDAVDPLLYSRVIADRAMAERQRREKPA